MKDGKIASFGTPKEVINSATLSDIFNKIPTLKPKYDFKVGNIL
jgi:hypothetical protein